MYGIISLGEWGEGGEPADRVAYPFKIKTTDENYQTELVNKDESPWKDTLLLGKILDREPALKDEWIKEVFHIIDHIVTEDLEVIAYLA